MLQGCSAILYDGKSVRRLEGSKLVKWMRTFRDVLMDGGDTRKRRATPPIENPIYSFVKLCHVLMLKRTKLTSCVLIVIIHWSGNCRQFLIRFS